MAQHLVSGAKNASGLGRPCTTAKRDVETRVGSPAPLGLGTAKGVVRLPQKQRRSFVGDAGPKTR